LKKQRLPALEAVPLKDRVKNLFPIRQKPDGAELYLVIAILVFGISACFLLPVSGGYDEETHLVRVWEMSFFSFLPNDKPGNEMPFPAVYWEMSYRRPFIVRAVETDFWEKYGGLSIEAHDYIYGDVETRSVYAPPLLFPQAMVMRYLGRSLQFPALTVFYACRLIGLLSYLVLVWLSVRLIPFGKWILAVLAASPVAILQASTISADAISNGIAFLFIAASLALANKKEIHWKEWGYLTVLFLILFWGKLNIVPLVLLPFLLIKPSRFKMRFGYIALLITAIVLFLLEVAGWNLLAYSRLSTAVGKADPLGQIRFIFTNPLHFSAILLHDVWANGYNRLLDWIAIYGYAYWPVPTLTYYLYLAGLFAAFFPEEKDDKIDKSIRIVLAVVFIITYLGTILSLYITFNPVGSDSIDGVQGRYFVMVMPILFLALACLPAFKRIQLPSFLPAILGVASLVLYITGMYLSYHVPCGSQFYKAGLCYQPNYKNWAPNEAYSAPISTQLTLAQEIVPECSGMTELRVWINAAGATPSGSTDFVLDNVDDGRNVTSINVPNSELPLGGWYSLQFQPEWSSSGKFYLLTIRGNNTGPRIAYSLRPEYPAGKLFENNQSLGQDMIFQTGCIAGWEKLLRNDSP
jgi:uncharacterized membrane protein